MKIILEYINSSLDDYQKAQDDSKGVKVPAANKDVKRLKLHTSVRGDVDNTSIKDDDNNASINGDDNNTNIISLTSDTGAHHDD